MFTYGKGKTGSSNIYYARHNTEKDVAGVELPKNIWSSSDMYHGNFKRLRKGLTLQVKFKEGFETGNFSLLGFTKSLGELRNFCLTGTLPTKAETKKDNVKPTVTKPANTKPVVTKPKTTKVKKGAVLKWHASEFGERRTDIYTVKSPDSCVAAAAKLKTVIENRLNIKFKYATPKVKYSKWEFKYLAKNITGVALHMSCTEK